MTKQARRRHRSLDPRGFFIPFVAMVLAACGATQGTAGDAGFDAVSDADAADCAPDFPADFELNFDLRPGRLRGNVTLSGAPLPWSAVDRGNIILFTTGIDYGFVLLGSDAPGTLDIPLAAGTYRILYSANEAHCRSEPSDPLCAAHAPSSPITVRAGEVTLADIDLRPRHLPVTLTLAGQPLRESTLGPRGTLSFDLNDSQGTTLTVPGVGAPTVDADLEPGTYRVRWTADPTACGPGLPCADGDLVSAFVVDGSGTPVSLDVGAVPPAAHIGGTVTVNGAPMGDALTPRGSLRFVVSGSSGWRARRAEASIGATGPAQYATTLPSGTYDVVWVAVPESCGTIQLPPAPCLSQTVRTGVVVTGDTVVDIDLHARSVMGTVTLNGAPLPDATGSSRGTIGFSPTPRRPDYEIALYPLPATGSATYSLLLLPGTYGVEWIPSGVACTALSATGLPCNRGAIRTELVVGENPARYDLDVSAVHVRGDLLFNGAAPASPPGNVASISFTQNSDLIVQSVEVSPDTTRTPAFDVLLLAGTYTVGWTPAHDTCMPGPVPTCISGTLLQNVHLDRDTALDVNVRSTRLHGALTVNGAPVADSSSDRGGMWFGPYGDTPLGTTGPATYDVMVLSTTESIYYYGPFDCAVGTPATAPLCGGAQLFECTGP